LRLAKTKYENQTLVELTFKDHYVGEGYPYLIVLLTGGKTVVELKEVSGSSARQVVSYRNMEFGHKSTESDILVIPVSAPFIRTRAKVNDELVAVVFISI
jgi:hypothetical protein